MASDDLTNGRRALGFFFSFGGSLTKWDREGILSREIRVLEAYLEQSLVDQVMLFTYDQRDHALIERLRATRPAFARIHALAPAGLLSHRAIYSLAGPVFHRARLRTASVLRTNQISGSWAAVIAKWLTGRSLVIRLGYILSRRHRLNGQQGRARVSAALEAMAFANADAIIVTSELAAEEIRTSTGKPHVVHLVPTYVDVETFVAKTSYDFSRPFLYIGRLTSQKNLRNLIIACSRLRHSLHIVGTGEQQAELEALAAEVGCDLTFLGKVPNEQLAVLMQDYSIFVLPSLHEGLPKALIEAMGTGMVCVGTDVPGTSDIITDGKNGYLAAGVTAEDLEAALRKALADKNAAFGAAARATVLDRYSLEVYIASEAAIFRSIAEAPAEAVH